MTSATLGVGITGSSKPKVSIVGMGYVGLSTAVCFAKEGIRVFGVEVDRGKLAMIKRGESPIHEKGIDDTLKEVLKAGTFSCSDDISEAVRNSDVTFLTVGTPSLPSGDIDLQYIKSAAAKVGEELTSKPGYHLVVVKSTVVPGTTLGIVRKILEQRSGKTTPQNFGLCVNPEFLREGTAVWDTFHADAVVIGGEDAHSGETLLALFKKFYGKDLPRVILTGVTNAEFIKYSINSFRAAQLSFLNTLANLCETVPSADAFEVIKGLSAVTKLDERYLRPGLGYGGSCLPKDVRALTAVCRNNGVDPLILEAATRLNEKQPLRAVEMARKVLGDLAGKKIAVLGLTFKAGTDDVRESVAISLVKALDSAGAVVSAYDPQGMINASPLLSETKVNLCESMPSCLSGADFCVIATEWKEFSEIPPQDFRKLMREPLVLDTKRILNEAELKSAGVSVQFLGRYEEGASRAFLEPEAVVREGMRSKP